MDLPELRHEVISWLHGDAAASIWRAGVKKGTYDWVWGEGASRPSPEGASSMLRGTEIIKLEKAELFYVSPQMTDLACAASRSLPAFDLAQADVPSNFGLMVFGRHPCQIDLLGHPIGLRAVSWGPHPNLRLSGQMLYAAVYADRQEVDPVIRANATYRDPASEPRLVLLHGAEFMARFGSGRERRAGAPWVTDFAPIVRSAWLLMQQTLAATVLMQPDRPAQRRLERTGRPPSQIRVIELRRREHQKPSGMSEREYHHQWVVRGHWRQQPCGLGRVERRPTWITPHIKGPEGAPMLGGEKVYAWKR